MNRSSTLIACDFAKFSACKRCNQATVQTGNMAESKEQEKPKNDTKEEKPPAKKDKKQEQEMVIVLTI